MFFISGSLSENFDLLLEGELFNGSTGYLTEIVIDTGLSGWVNEAPIVIPDKICTNLRLVKSKETLEMWSPLEDKPVKCHTSNLGVRLKENNETKFETDDVMTIILPNLDDDEILLGPDFLTTILRCKRIIIDYEKYSLRLVL